MDKILPVQEGANTGACGLSFYFVFKANGIDEDGVLESLSPMFRAIQKQHRILNPDRNGHVIIVAHEPHESE